MSTTEDTRQALPQVNVAIRAVKLSGINMPVVTDHQDSPGFLVAISVSVSHVQVSWGPGVQLTVPVNKSEYVCNVILAGF